MKRKSPTRHTVKSHKREGSPVKSFTRGKGGNPTKHVVKEPRKVTRNSNLSKSELLILLRVYETDDYQKRGGNYPNHNKPDAIRIYEFKDGVRVILEFKNYSNFAETWTKTNFVPKVKQKLAGTGWEVSRILSRDVGDYEGDWAETDVIVTEVK